MRYELIYIKIISSDIYQSPKHEKGVKRHNYPKVTLCDMS
jgi:hypothetical protein